MIDAEAVKRAVRIESVVAQYTTLKERGGELWGNCPIHKEKTPSFAVNVEKQRFFCQGCGAGGDVIEFVQQVEGFTFIQAKDQLAEIAGLAGSGTLSNRTNNGGEPIPVGPVTVPPAPAPAQPEVPAKHVATYDYVDAAGALLYQVLRYEPKTFKQRRPTPDGEWVWGLGDVERVLYRLPAVIAADTVYVCEGEKDVHTLEALGYVATTNSGGANGKWAPAMYEVLRGKQVIILPDQDPPGLARGKALQVALNDIARVAIFNVPSGKDVTDYVEAAGGEAFGGLIAKAWQAKRDEEFRQRGLLTVEEVAERAGGASALLGGQKKGLQTGFHIIDKMTLGLHGGELTILAARPAMGKTALALNIAGNIARNGSRVAVFSLEMSDQSLLSRLVCSEARLDGLLFRGGYLNAEHRARARRTYLDISQWPLMIDDNPGATHEGIVRKLRALREDGTEIALVIVDYLQLMRGGGRVENRNQEVSAISRGLKLAARELDVPFLVLSQLSRSVETRTGDHVPQLSDLRDSGSIEQDADVVMFIHREEVYKQDRPELKGLANVIIAKQRNGPIGKVPLVFINQHTRFENATDIQEAAA